MYAWHLLSESDWNSDSFKISHNSSADTEVRIQEDNFLDHILIFFMLYTQGLHIKMFACVKSLTNIYKVK